jgi:hypothetical protein
MEAKAYKLGPIFQFLICKVVVVEVVIILKKI